MKHKLGSSLAYTGLRRWGGRGWNNQLQEAAGGGKNLRPPDPG